MTIREYLTSLGAKDAELSAKVVSRMEKAMLFDTDITQFKLDTAVSVINNATSALYSASHETDSTINRAKTEQINLEGVIRRAQSEIADLKTQTAGIRDAKINNSDTRDAVMAYAATLNATREIFGADNITPEVMVAAINAGSYIAWRGIMGPKDNENRIQSRTRY